MTTEERQFLKVKRMVIKEKKEYISDIVKNAKKVRYRGYTCTTYGPNTTFITCKYCKSHRIMLGNVAESKGLIDHMLHTYEMIPEWNAEDKAKFERSFCADEFDPVGVVYELDRRKHFNKL